MSDHIVRMVQCVSQSRVNGFVGLDSYMAALEELKPVEAMREYVLLSLGIPRAMGKTFSIVQVARRVLPTTLVIAPTGRQLDFIKHEALREAQETDRPPVKSTFRTIDAFKTMCKLHARFSLNLSVYDGVIVDEWQQLSREDQDLILTAFVHVAKKNPEFVLLALCGGG